MQLTIFLKSFHIKIINFNLIKILEKIQGLSLKMKVYNIVTLPCKLERYTVLRSPHIDKKSREQFEIKTYKKSFAISMIQREFNFLKKLKIFLIFLKNTSSGCNIKITFFI